MPSSEHSESYKNDLTNWALTWLGASLDAGRPAALPGCMVYSASTHGSVPNLYFVDAPITCHLDDCDGLGERTEERGDMAARELDVLLSERLLADKRLLLPWRQWGEAYRRAATVGSTPELPTAPAEAFRIAWIGLVGGKDFPVYELPETGHALASRTVPLPRASAALRANAATNGLPVHVDLVAPHRAAEVMETYQLALVETSDESSIADLLRLSVRTGCRLYVEAPADDPGKLERELKAIADAAKLLVRLHPCPAAAERSEPEPDPRRCAGCGVRQTGSDEATFAGWWVLRAEGAAAVPLAWIGTQRRLPVLLSYPDRGSWEAACQRASRAGELAQAEVATQTNDPAHIQNATSKEFWRNVGALISGSPIERD